MNALRRAHGVTISLDECVPGMYSSCALAGTCKAVPVPISTMMMIPCLVLSSPVAFHTKVTTSTTPTEPTHDFDNENVGKDGASKVVNSIKQL